MEFSRQNTVVGSHSLLQQILPTRGLNEPRSPTLQTDSLPAESQGKPKNTGVGSLSLLQRIFPTQESNWGFLHCWQILYQLSNQGSPYYLYLYLYSYDSQSSLPSLQLSLQQAAEAKTN